MYKLMVLDDEKVIRRGLIQYIPWEQLGFELAGEFDDGKDAIKFLQTHEIDVVLTDIQMTEVSGLQLAEYIHDHYPHIKVVLISGYKEFDYAQKAIQYGVTSYLLKPTDYDDIVEVFTTLKLSLDRDKAEQVRMMEEQKRFLEAQSFVQEQFFIDVLMGALKQPEELRNRLDQSGLDPRMATMHCMCVDIDMQSKVLPDHKPPNGKDQIQMYLKHAFKKNEDNFRVYPVFAAFKGFKLLVFTAEPCSPELGWLADEFQKEIETIDRLFGIKVVLLHHSSSLNIEQLAAVEHTPIRLEQDLLSGEMRINADENNKITERYKLFVSSILMGDHQNATTLLDRFFEEFRELPVHYIQKLIKQLFVTLEQTFSRSGDSVTKLIFNMDDFESRDNVERIKSWSEATLETVIHETVGIKDESTRQIIESGKAYIMNHYHEDISLEDVADHVFLNSAYFSRMFKQYTGVNFTEFLTDIRIDKAIQLMKEDKYKIYEISGLVGFSYSKYFSKIFKRKTGSTPKEYYRNIRK